MVQKTRPMPDMMSNASTTKLELSIREPFEDAQSNHAPGKAAVINKSERLAVQLRDDRG